MPRVKVGPKYQVVIPKIIRRKINLRPGDVVDVEGRKGEVVVRKSGTPFVDKYAGILKGAYDEFGGVEKYLENERSSWDD